MSSQSDTSVHEDEHDLLVEYENEEKNELSDGGQAEEAEEAQEAGSDRDDENESKGRRVDPTKKRVVRNPIPKLNTERLKGPKGIHTIENYFEGFKFYGKGREKEDLDRIMKRLEHWSHRLFPKLHFDDFLAKVEKLGSKKDLCTFIKKYRQDMITASDGLLVPDTGDLDEENQENEPIDEFDLLIAEQIEKQKQAARNQKQDPNSSVSDLTANASSAAFDQLLSQSNTQNESTSSQPPNNTPNPLPDEVKERMERNRQLAIQRRLERLQAMKEEAKKQKLEE